MARQDWDEELARFAKDWLQTGIKPEPWCVQRGHKWSSAKDYISEKKARLYLESSGIKIPKKDTSNSEKNRKQLRKKNSEKCANSESEKHAKTASKSPSASIKKNAAPEPLSTAVCPEDYGISEQQALFSDHVVQGKTRVDAYRLAGYIGEGNVAYAAASRLLRNVKVSRYIHALRNERQKRYAVELDDLITQLTAIINADPNALSQYRRVNCRYCWGEGYKYQWRDIEEQLQAEKRAEIDKKPPPDVSGGVGFVDNADPNPDCPRCLGEGKGEAFFPDTRDIEGDERYLLQGVKVTMNGVQIVAADKDAARRELARLLAIRGADARQTELNLQRLELQNKKLRAEVDELLRKVPPPDEETAAQIAPDIPPQEAEIQYSRILK